MSRRCSTSTSSGRADDVEAVTAQRLGRTDVIGIRDRLVFGPDAGMVGDHGAATEDPDPPQICGHLDAPAERNRYTE